MKATPYDTPAHAARKPPTVLYAVSEYGEFFSLIEIAKILGRELGLQPVFLFKSDYGALDTHSRVLERLNFSWTTAQTDRLYFDARDVRPGISDYVPSSLRVAQNLPEVASATVPAEYSWYFRVYAHLKLRRSATLMRKSDEKEQRQLNRIRRRFFQGRHYAWTMKVIKSIIAEFQPVLIISGQDYPLSVTTLAAHVGSEAGIRTAIIPFSMTPTTKEIAESFFGSRTNEIRSGVGKRFMQKWLGNWLHTYRGRVYSRLTPSEALVSNALGLTPAQPWTPNAGKGIVFAPSQQGYDYCVSAGIPPSQVQLTGAVWSDKLIEQASTRQQRRDDLLRDILVFETYARNVSRARTVPRRADTVQVEPSDSERPLLIFSWPPNQSPRRPNGMSTFDQLNKGLTELLISLAMSSAVKIAISLHPTLQETAVGADLRHAGLYVIDRPLIDVVDCADIFCATVSSTLLWCSQLSIPSVNFDIYSYGYKEFTEAGMSEAATLPSLRDELSQMIRDKEYRASVSHRMADRRDYWTISDGASTKRIVGFVKELLKHSDE